MLSDTELRRRLQQLVRSGEVSAVTVRSDRTVALERVVELFDIVRSSGVQKLALATEIASGRRNAR